MADNMCTAENRFIGVVELKQDNNFLEFMPENEYLDNRLKRKEPGTALEMLQENSGFPLEDLVKKMAKKDEFNGNCYVKRALEVISCSFASVLTSLAVLGAICGN